ncbi:hypothetical protein BU14_0692s0011 [Porphyra umbilicalis]|uniref:Uncharacterized protein n=1 Tax=Porphyra umbilicalis TaxID=2786 RepID=A0A1X6NPZ0_PORUM|nr:hypothetical protein BU14_0692s0011 [Porphyra umbilicalis]|eukprot:OSX70678.1 hypothetical protein BU14_0692s0011 [Porphyra umbilicalis]
MLLFWRVPQVPAAHRRWTHDVPRWGRLLIVAAVVGVIFAASPAQQKALFGKAWTSLDLCQDRGPKLDAVAARLANLTEIDAAEAYVADKAKVVARMEALAAAFYKPPAQLQWPNGCTAQAAAVASARVCRQVPVCRRVLFVCLPGEKTLCIDTKVADDRAQAELVKIDEEKARLARLRQRANSSEPGGPRSVLADAQAVGSRTADKVAWALGSTLTAHTYYMALGLYFRAPLRSFRHRQWRHAPGLLFSFSKTKFVIAGSVALLAARPLGDVLGNADWWFYVNSFATDPCLVDPAFVRDRNALAVAAAANWSAVANVSVGHDARMADVYTGARRMALCENGAGAKVHHPRVGDMNRTLSYYQAHPMPGTSNVTALVASLAAVDERPRAATLLLALVRDRMLARVLFRTFLISVLQSLFVLVWPALGYSGVAAVPAETDGGLPTTVGLGGDPRDAAAAGVAKDVDDDSDGEAAQARWAAWFGRRRDSHLPAPSDAHGDGKAAKPWWPPSCFGRRGVPAPPPAAATPDSLSSTMTDGSDVEAAAADPPPPRGRWLPACLAPSRGPSPKGAAASDVEAAAADAPPPRRWAPACLAPAGGSPPKGAAASDVGAAAADARSPRTWAPACLAPAGGSPPKGAAASEERRRASRWAHPSTRPTATRPVGGVGLAGRWLYEDWCLAAIRRARWRVAVVQVTLLVVAVGWLAYSEVWARGAGRATAAAVNATAPVAPPPAAVCPAAIRLCSR